MEGLEVFSAERLAKLSVIAGNSLSCEMSIEKFLAVKKVSAELYDAGLRKVGEEKWVSIYMDALCELGGHSDS